MSSNREGRSYSDQKVSMEPCRKTLQTSVELMQLYRLNPILHHIRDEDQHCQLYTETMTPQEFCTHFDFQKNLTLRHIDQIIFQGSYRHVDLEMTLMNRWNFENCKNCVCVRIEGSHRHTRDWVSIFAAPIAFVDQLKRILQKMHIYAIWIQPYLIPACIHIQTTTKPLQQICRTVLFRRPLRLSQSVQRRLGLENEDPALHFYKCVLPQLCFNCILYRYYYYCINVDKCFELQ